MSKRGIRLIGVAMAFAIAQASSAGDLLSVRNTGIPAMAGPFGMRWCDGSHLLLNGIQMRGGRPTLLLDTSTMTETVASLFDGNGNRLFIRATDCRGLEIFGSRKEARLSYLFTGTNGSTGRLVAVLKDFGFVSIAGKYVLGNTPKVQVADAYRIETDCAVNHDADYRLLCWDIWNRRVWLLSKHVLVQYTWTDYISVERDSGGRVDVKNREPMLRRRNGSSANGSILLKDLTGRVLANLSDDPAITASRYQIATDPGETYAYSPCKDIDGFDGGFDSVCRYALDGRTHQWEKVFTITEVKRSKGEVAEVDIAPNGDIYVGVGVPAPYGVKGIWKYSVAGGSLRQVTRAPLLGQGDQSPKVSRDGRRLAFVRSEDGPKLFISDLRRAEHE